MGIKGYKAFDKDLRCRGKQYEVGKVFEEDGELEVCGHGMHFCQAAADVFDYYSFTDRPRFCEVEALGDVLTDGNKSCTNRLRIVRELAWDEVLAVANSGSDNTGYGNSGDWNSGDRNSGDRNSGDRTSGYRNSGYRNSGDRNSGDRNSGDWNMTNFSSGVLCTEEPECLIFDKPSGMTLREWRNSRASWLMSWVETSVNVWVNAAEMTDEEKRAHPEHETLGGYLRKGTYESDFAGWWGKLTDDDKRVILAIPNFDADKWERITGLDVRDDMKRLGR